MEVVEQPLGGRGDEPPGPHVVRQGVVGESQDAGVVLEPRQDALGERPRIDGEPRRERQRAILEALRAEELVAEGLLGRAWRSPAVAVAERAHELPPARGHGRGDEQGVASGHHPRNRPFVKGMPESAGVLRKAATSF